MSAHSCNGQGEQAGGDLLPNGPFQESKHERCLPSCKIIFTINSGHADASVQQLELPICKNAPAMSKHAECMGSTSQSCRPHANTFLQIPRHQQQKVEGPAPLARKEQMV